MSPLAGHVGYWLRHASNQVSQALSCKLEDKGVTLAEWVVRTLREIVRRGGSRAAPAD